MSVRQIYRRNGERFTLVLMEMQRCRLLNGMNALPAPITLGLRNFIISVPGVSVFHP
jgi:hypothetical protein